MLKRILRELLSHVPFTAIGAVVGIIVMVIIHYASTSTEVSEALFFTFHPFRTELSVLGKASQFFLFQMLLLFQS